MEGVAHTSGTRTHKEVWLSLDYVYACRERAEAEIAGVLVHEMVHCFQHDANGTCPGGLIEGIAGMFLSFIQRVAYNRSLFYLLETRLRASQ